MDYHKEFTAKERRLLKNKSPYKRLAATWKFLRSYLHRNKITYVQYLQSEHWRKMRKRKGLNRPRRCDICERPNTEVQLNLHHRTYRRIGRERPDDLCWLCDDCHKLVHRKAKLLYESYLERANARAERRRCRREERANEQKG